MPGAWRKNKRLLQNLHILLRLFQFCSQSFILGEQIRFTAAADGILQSGSLLFCRPRQPQSVSFLVPCRRAAPRRRSHLQVSAPLAVFLCLFVPC